MKPDDFEPFVLSEAMFVEQRERFLPLPMDTEVEDSEPKVLGNFGEVVFRIGFGHFSNLQLPTLGYIYLHAGQNRRSTKRQVPSTKEIPSSKWHASPNRGRVESAVEPAHSKAAREDSRASHGRDPNSTAVQARLPLEIFWRDLPRFGAMCRGLPRYGAVCRGKC